jgi:hypothetical protein
MCSITIKKEETASMKSTVWEWTGEMRLAEGLLVLPIAFAF